MRQSLLGAAPVIAMSLLFVLSNSLNAADVDGYQGDTATGFKQNQANGFTLAVNANILNADGEPANDILGYGFAADFTLSARWAMVLGLDVFNYDFENPSKLLNIPSASEKVIDAATSSTMLSVKARRDLPRISPKGQAYWGFGVGINRVEVEEARGPVTGAGEFRIRTKVDNEVVPQLNLGLHYRVQRNWLTQASFGVHYHLADWRIEDVNSGATASLGNYLTWALQLGIAYQFE